LVDLTGIEPVTS